MLLSSLLPLLVLALARVASAGNLGYPRNLPYCTISCMNYATGYTFSCVYGEDYGEYIDCLMNDFAAAGTFALCLNDYCDGRGEALQAYKMVKYYTKGVPYKYTYDVALPLAIANHTDGALVNETTLNTVPFSITQEMYDEQYPTIVEFNFQLKSGELYGAATMLYWFGIMFLASCWRLFTTMFPGTLRRSTMLTKLVRKYITFPSLVSYSHTLPVRVLGFPFGFLPTRWESIVVAGFLIMNTVLLMVNYKLFPNNTYWPDDEGIQLVRYFADRSGIMAMVQIPILFLFAGRNNFLQWCTGWSFQSFMVYHRWVARAMTVNAVLHSVGYTNYGIHYGYLAYYYEDMYWRMGVVSTCAAGVIIVQAMYLLRHKWYETFLLLHIILVLTFFIGLYYHLAIDDLGYYEYIWATVAVWGFDRAFRLVRIALYGWATKAEFRIVSPDVFEIRVKTRGWLKPKKAHPGQYSFIHIGRFRGWESHPFSLLDVDLASGTYVYWCKAFDGMTRNVYKYLEAQPDNRASLRVAVDGFYGEKFPLEHHDSVVLVAGGIGITAMAQYAKYLKSRLRERQHLVLHWITRLDVEVRALEPMLAALADAVDVTVYVTKDTAPTAKTLDEKASTDGEDADEKVSASSSASSGPIRVVYGRPDMFPILEREIATAEGSVAVAVCGPEALNDSCRNIVASLATGGRPGMAVQYFEESFAWA
ncbi:ferric reductase like transmembrane component-domain-containing protein, partial [Dipodascopsis tothii]|uniref:ferric reductase like transmembrane component-domain-containing protein n=1 Tax=Dipodascopsis tothii TaxID=44089 RepID=UPI0034CF05E2